MIFYFLSRTLIDKFIFFPFDTYVSLEFQVRLYPKRTALGSWTQKKILNTHLCWFYSFQCFIIRNISNNKTLQLQQVILLLIFFHYI